MIIKMENIKISIIVPAYNVGKWLPRCIKSVINQTHKNWELILIDDGSTDNTGDIVDLFAKRDKRIIAVHQKNVGLVEVREKGINLATGDYIGFIDGDDAIDPFMYEWLLYNAITYDADISHCGLRVCYNEIKDEQDTGTGKILVQNRNEAIRDLLSGEWMTPSLCNKLYKKKLLEGSCLDKNIINNEDLLRNFVLFKRAKKIVFQDFHGYQYWSRESSLSNDKKVIIRMKNILDARQCILNNCESDIKQYAIRSWLQALVNCVNCLTFCTDKECQQLCEDCRMELMREKKHLGLLIRRQQLAAVLILVSPRIHRWFYRIYRER